MIVVVFHQEHVQTEHDISPPGHDKTSFEEIQSSLNSTLSLKPNPGKQTKNLGHRQNKNPEIAQIFQFIYGV